MSRRLCSLTKDYRYRPKYKELLEHPWIRWHEKTHADVAGWFREARAKMAVAQAQSASPGEQTQARRAGAGGGSGAGGAAAAAALPDSGVISNQPAAALGDVSVERERDKFEHMAEAATRHKAEMLERLANPVAQHKNSATRHYSSGCGSASSSVNNSLSTTPTAPSKPLPGAAAAAGHSSLANASTAQRSSAASRVQHSNSPAAVPHGRSSTTALCGWRRQLSAASTPCSHGSSGSIASPCSASGASAARAGLEAVPMGALSDAPEDSPGASTTGGAVGSIPEASSTPPVPYRQAHSRTRKISVV